MKRFFRILIRIILWGFILLLLVAAIASWYIYNNLEPFVENRIKATIRNKTNGLYELEYTNFELSLAERYLLIGSLYEEDTVVSFEAKLATVLGKLNLTTNYAG
jgi:hypothetical protein